MHKAKMKGLKEIKYTDQWFQDQGQNLRIETTDKQLTKFKAHLNRRRGGNKKFPYRWAAAATILMAVATLMFTYTLPQNDTPIMTLMLEDVDPYYNDYRDYLQSEQYATMKASYLIQED